MDSISGTCEWGYGYNDEPNASWNCPTGFTHRAKVKFAAMKEMLDTRLYTDFELCFGGQTMLVHKAVLCSQSSVFAKACKSFKEGQAGVYQIDIEIKASLVRAMIDFLYMNDYDDVFQYGDQEPSDTLPFPAAPTKDRIGFNVSVYGVADYFDLPALRDLALAKTESAMEKLWDLEDFMKALHIAYENIPAEVTFGLRQKMASHALIHFPQVSEHDSFALLNAGDFGKDLMKQFKGTYAWVKLICGTCGFVLPDPLGNMEVRDCDCPLCGSIHWKGEQVGDQRRLRSTFGYKYDANSGWGGGSIGW